MTLNEWAESHGLKTARVVEAVKRLVQEGRIELDAPQSGEAQLDDALASLLAARFHLSSGATDSGATGGGPRPPVSSDASGSASALRHGTDHSPSVECGPVAESDFSGARPYAFSGEDPTRPGNAGAERIVPVKRFAVARQLDRAAIFVYATDETDAIAQFIEMQGVPEPHRCKFKVEWCDAPQVHLATRMPHGRYGKHGAYTLVETAETCEEPVELRDPHNHLLAKKAWKSHSLIEWKHARFDPSSRQFIPNNSIRWDRERFCYVPAVA